jgi:NADPH2:quinone reductase
LIHGASGSVGIAAIQLAKTLELRVIGTAGTPEGLKMIQDQGVDFAFNHRDKDYIEKITQQFVQFPNGIDIILEMLANVNLNNDMQLLSFKRGRIVVRERLLHLAY